MFGPFRRKHLFVSYQFQVPGGRGGFGNATLDMAEPRDATALNRIAGMISAECAKTHGGDVGVVILFWRAMA